MVEIVATAPSSPPAIASTVCSNRVTLPWVRFGTVITHPISCVVMNFAIGANSALMIASNAPTASFAISPPNPPSSELIPLPIRLIGFGIEIPVSRIPLASAAGGDAADPSSSSASTTMATATSGRRPRPPPAGRLALAALSRRGPDRRRAPRDRIRPARL